MTMDKIFGNSKATTIKLKLEHEKRYLAAQSKTEEQWSEIPPELNDAYELISCALIGIHHKAILKFDLNEKQSKDFIAVHAPFLRGINLTMFSIKSARYSQAHNLIKNEIESVAAVQEIDKGTRKSGINPKVNHLPDALKTMYGLMNNVAHPGNIKSSLNPLGTQTPEGRQISTYPIFNKKYAQSLFELHCGLCIEFAYYALKISTEMGFENELKDEQEFVTQATAILNKTVKR